MAVSNAYLNECANAMRTKVKYLGLVDDNGDEITGGGYERMPVTWTTAPASGVGVLRPTDSIVFSVLGGGTVIGGWRGYSAKTGGTDYGGIDFPVAEQEEFKNDGEVRLVPEKTALKHEVKS